MKRFLSAFLVMLMLFSVAACDTPPSADTNAATEADTQGRATEQITEKETENMTEAVTEEQIVDEDPVFFEKADRDPFDPASADVSGADWVKTIENANGLADGVQGRFTDADRSEFQIFNNTSSLRYGLTETGKKLVTGLYNANGAPYFENTMDAYVINSAGTKFSGAYSYAAARMNSNRIGYYYYDFRFRDQDLADPDAVSAEGAYYDIIAKGKGWGSNDVTKFSNKRGVISYNVKSVLDPYVYASVDYSAEEFDAVKITINAEYSTVAYLYLIAGSAKDYNQPQMIACRFLPGKKSTVVVPLSSLPDYTGRVKGFRLDCGVQGGEHVEITEIKAIKCRDLSVPLALERIFHTYPDKMHDVVRIVATDDYENGGRFETETVIPADTVRKFILKNAQGEVSELEGFDFSTTEYVGFDVKGAGVFGIIMPDAKNNGYINVTQKDGNYVIIRGIEITKTIRKGEDVQFGHRIYTTSSHQFNDLRKEAFIERNPLTDIYVQDVDNAKYLGYDALAGCYGFGVRAIEFDQAMYRQPDKHFNVNTTVRGDGVVDRTIYIRTAENASTRRGRLECAAILDEESRMLPIPLEVGKNFDGENEEPLYYPEKGTGRAAFGEVYAPITVGKDECKRYTVLHLYQNWGKYPLKQISFIAFHIPYYHLSVGVTETNCITPYYVYGKDAWVLPDFRANSAPLWDNGRGTQHTSIGRLYFLQYKDADGVNNKSESQHADIASSGPVYADINTEYLSDDGRIKASYRHTEMAQTDENRTFYHIKLEVLDDVKIKDFKKDFSFFSFDSYTVLFSNMGYLDENGGQITEDTKEQERIIKLGKEYPYIDYYGGNLKESVNFALIIKGSDITVGGKKYDGNFVVRDKCDGVVNYAALTLDLGNVTLKKGDILEIDMILLPWGYSTSKDDSNVRGVREDSCVDPYKITVIEGEAYADSVVPSVRAKNNTAKFTISGGRSTAAVRIYGFTDYKKPDIKFKADGKDTDIELAGPNGYDGYQVNRDEDGTYSFSFNVDMNKANEYEITVIQ
ncbi:MAG: hypothetical protein II135_11160 [Clostridia bacterium]|nr:hypothetical protein [Clostridia bacterium]